MKPGIKIAVAPSANAIDPPSDTTIATVQAAIDAGADETVDAVVLGYRTFWTPEVADLAGRRDRTAHAVVADWLEENGCVRAAEVFRDDEHHFWRTVLSELAHAAPEIAPRGAAIALFQRAVNTLGEQQRRILESVGVTYGFDLNIYLGSSEPPPFPGAPEADPDDGHSLPT